LRTAKKLIDEDPAYGHMVCRCELVTEGEIKSVLKMQPAASDLDGIKRRVRATAGRCQGGFLHAKNYRHSVAGAEPEL